MQRSKGLGNLSASGYDQPESPFSLEILYANVSSSFIPNSSPTTDCSSESFPTTPEDLPSSPSSSIPFSTAPPKIKHPCRSHPSKAGRKPKKPAASYPAKRRKSPKGRVRPQSQPWLDAVFFGKGVCKHCEGGSRSNRQDRLLEHLVSSHFIQPIKDMERYDRQELEDEAEYRLHYIKTRAQFEYTRRFIDLVKCSLCVKDTSLVFRDDNIVKHLESMHAKVDKTTREEERIRLMGLRPDKKRWYNIHDKFLYEFPNY
ncbi:hypothetical protein Clacol_009579 [Clathrus columnatus]|uniref:BED-type domain-containing protein n=1 Tax=Clathrus columnatus TaxID=1419009 RepID=A0AAV5AP77_9AGAM|nr:hypothetical protein Clacol_009579 [Clathrus columnatus]